MGIAQPVAGALSDRYGPAAIVAASALLYAFGLTAVALQPGLLSVILGLGILAGLGQSGMTFAVVMSAVSRAASNVLRATAVALAVAGASVGQVALVRVAQSVIQPRWVSAVGVDRVAAEAAVTKRTLYHHFASKDALFAAALRRAPKIRFPREGSPRSLITGAFRAMIEFLQDTAYRGCPYIIVAAELVDARHPARVVVNDLVRRRRQWFRERAADAGAAQPDLLAEQFEVLFDGALANATKRGETTPAEAALIAAEALLDAATAQPKTARRGSRKAPAVA